MEFEGVHVDCDCEITLSNWHRYAEPLHDAIRRCMVLTGEWPSKLFIRCGVVFAVSPKLTDRAYVIGECSAVALR